MASIIGADAREICSVRNNAKRFGTNSPKTKEKYAITRVTPMSEIVLLQFGSNPISSNHGITYSPSFSAPNAADKNPQTVTPTCAAARNRFGFCASKATRLPRLPLVAN